MINIVLLTTIVCFIVDISGFVDSVKGLIWKLVIGKNKPFQDFNMKPFDCSLCCSFWVGLIHLLCVGQFNIPMIGFVCLFSLLSSNITGLLIVIREGINYLLSLLSKNL